MVIFTTDYLMRDGRDHTILHECRFLGRARLEDHAVFTLGWPFFTPLLSESVGNACWGEAFALPRHREDALLRELDHYHQQMDRVGRKEARVMIDGFPLNVIVYFGPIPGGSAPLENWINLPSIARPDRRRYARAE